MGDLTKTYKFTREELQVLQKCSKESFYQRCLPFMTIFGSATYYAIKSGFLKPSLTMGAGPKVVGAVAMGYFLGKVSYQEKCAEMMMRLPNSELAEMLRKQRQGKGGGGMPSELLTLDPGFGSGGFPSFGSSAPSKDVYSDLDMRPYQDLDVDRPLNEGLDDSFRPSLDYAALEDETSLPERKQGPPVTYDDLRKKNREEYAQQRSNPYRPPPATDQSPNSISQSPSPCPQQPTIPADQDFPSRLRTYAPNTDKEKNKYGDVWEK